MSDVPPPPPNPILTAYENFVRETPLVTRTVITSQFVTWIMSFFFDPSYAVSNIPYFTIYKFEIYRIFLSPFICPSLISLVFAYLSFKDNGRRLEYSMGSASFCGLLLTLGCLTNLLHIVVCFILYGLSGGGKNQSFLFWPSLGVWIFLFAVIAIDCVTAQSNSMRKLFFFTVPTIYYPLALFGIFSIFGGFQLSYVLSIAIGYAYGLGHLDKLKISDSRYKHLEETILHNFTQRDGWIASQNATGSWSNNDLSLSETGSSGDNNGGGGGGFDFSRFAAPLQQQQQQQQQISGGQSQQPQRMGGSGNISGFGGSSTRDPERGERSTATTTSAATAGFPTGAGRQLGSAEQRRNVASEREKRLLALERSKKQTAEQQSATTRSSTSPKD